MPPGTAPVAITTQQQFAFGLTVVGQGRGGWQCAGHKQTPEASPVSTRSSRLPTDVQRRIAMETKGWITQLAVCVFKQQVAPLKFFYAFEMSSSGTR